MFFVDAHVHIYDCFDLELFFNSAFNNFRAEAARLDKKDAFIGVLLLGETSKYDFFHQLASLADNGNVNGFKAIGNWTLHHTAENVSLCAKHGENGALFLIAGRQIATAEKMEVLALATENKFRDCIPIAKAIQSVRDAGALTVIPYGFGKWSGRRRALVRDLLENAKEIGVLLGDNGGCPGFLPRRSYFQHADRKGIRILPGSDPLPLSADCKRVGSFGFYLDKSLSLEHPARDLKEILMNPALKIRTYGRRERPWSFFRKQLSIRLRRSRTNKYK